MADPLYVRVYPTETRWVAEGINCDIRLSFVSKDRLYEAIRKEADHVRSDNRVLALANAA